MSRDAADRLQTSRDVPLGGGAEPALKKVENWLAECDRHASTVMFALCVLMALQVSSWWYATPDSAAYLSIARGIAIHGTLSNLGNPHIAYPPGYPLLVSPAFLFAAKPFVFIGAIHWLLAVLFMLGLYRWTSRLDSSGGLLMTTLVMVNVSLWNYYRQPLSEFAFMAVLIWTVEALWRVLDESSFGKIMIHTVTAMVLLCLLTMIRETGVIIAVGFAIAALLEISHDPSRLKPRLLALATLVAGASIALLAFVRFDAAMAARSPAVFGTHLSGFVYSLSDFRTKVPEGLRLRVSEIGRLLIPGMFKTYARPGQWLNANMAIYISIAILSGVGWWRLVLRKRDLFAMSAPFYIALYVLWAFDADTRYLLPLLPVLVVSLWFLTENLRQVRATIFAGLVVAHLAVAVGYWIFIDAPRARECNSYWRPLTTLGGSISQPDQGVLAIKVPGCVQPMLEFLLDRPVKYADTSSALGADDRWLVTTKSEEPAYSNFKAAGEAGNFVLMLQQ